MLDYLKKRFGKGKKDSSEIKKSDSHVHIDYHTHQHLNDGGREAISKVASVAVLCMLAVTFAYCYKTYQETY